MESEVKITEAKFTSRRRQGEYEYDEAHLSAVIGTVPCVEDVLIKLRNSTLDWVTGKLKGGVTREVTQEKVEAPVVAHGGKKTAKGKAEKVEAPKVEEKVEEVVEQTPVNSKEQDDADVMAAMGLATEEAPKVESKYTIEDARKALTEVYQKVSAAAAKKILTDKGIKEVSSIPNSEIDNIIKEANAALKAAKKK